MCAILFTSGTTGKSKGVMLTHKSLTDNATCMDMEEPEGSIMLSVLPIHHAYCFTCDILAGMCTGAVVCFNDSIMRLAKNIGIFKPNIVLLVPMIIESVFTSFRRRLRLIRMYRSRCLQRRYSGKIYAQYTAAELT